MNDNSIYFCTHCRKQVSELDNVLLVEDHFPRGFCSEECIEIFFRPLIEYFEKWEENLRLENKIEGDPEFGLQQYNNYLNETLRAPHEIYLLRNELGEEIYFYFCEFEKDTDKSFTMAVSCLVFEHSPSFIFWHTISSHNELINQLKVGERISNIYPFITGGKGVIEEGVQADKAKAATANSEDGNEELIIDPETMESLELKRSTQLAELMEIRLESDVPYEDFHMYEQYIKKTIEEPDEVYKYIDDEGDTMMTYIRSYQQGQISFFYLVLCCQLDDKKDSDDRILMPILSFPSLDGDLYRHYRKGEQVSGTLKS